MNPMVRNRTSRSVGIGIILVLFLPALPEEGAAQWVQIPVPSQTHYIQNLVCGSTYLFASVRDSSWSNVGLFRTPIESAGEWESLGLEGYSLRSMVVAGFDDSHILAMGVGETQILGSTDGGETWTPHDAGIEDDGRWVTGMDRNSAFPGRVYAGVYRPDPGGFWIYSSTDFGTNWSKWTGNEVGIAMFRYFAIPQDEGLLAYAMLENGFQTLDRHKSTDGGDVWSYVPRYLEGGIIDLDLSTDHRDLFAASIDGALVWWRDDSYWETAIIPPVANCGQIGSETPVWAPGVLFVAGVDPDSVLMVVSTEFPYGKEWTVMQDGFPDTKFFPCEAYDPFHGGFMYKFEAAPHAPYLFVSTPGGGLWMREMSEVVGVTEPEGLVHGDLEFLPLGPNPTSGRLVFSAPGAGGLPITVAVVDVSGRLIRRWTTTPAASDGRVTWDCRGTDGRVVPPGAYYLKARSANGTAMTRFTIIR